MEGDIIGDNGNWMVYEFLSTPSAWRATLCPLHPKASRGISIHALRMEGDRNASCPRIRQQISIHALRMEGDNEDGETDPNDFKFLSTPSAWRATNFLPALARYVAYFYPRPPHGGRRIATVDFSNDFEISIHALRMEGDAGQSRAVGRRANFYPRPPHGGRQ